MSEREMPKSAEDDLFKGMYTLPKAERRRRIDAYAHELAEKVMALRAAVPDLKARQLFKDGYDAALIVAALTIDSKKEGQ